MMKYDYFTFIDQDHTISLDYIDYTLSFVFLNVHLFNLSACFVSSLLEFYD